MEEFIGIVRGRTVNSSRTPRRDGTPAPSTPAPTKKNVARRPPARRGPFIPAPILPRRSLMHLKNAPYSQHEIGPNWTNRRDSSGRRRLEDPKSRSLTQCAPIRRPHNLQAHTGELHRRRSSARSAPAEQPRLRFALPPMSWPQQSRPDEHRKSFCPGCGASATTIIRGIASDVSGVSPRRAARPSWPRITHPAGRY